MRTTSLEKSLGSFAILGFFGPFFWFSFVFNFRFFLFLKYLIMSDISLIIFIWKVTSKSLIWPHFECYSIHLKWWYGIFNIFLIFWNFPSSKISLQPLDRIELKTAHYFCFLLWITRSKKNLDLFFNLGTLGHFSDFHTFLIFVFFLFFKYLIASQVLAIIFIWKLTSRP